MSKPKNMTPEQEVEWKEKRKAIAKAHNQRPEVQIRLKAYRQTPEYKARNREAKKIWRINNPEKAKAKDDLDRVRYAEKRKASCLKRREANRESARKKTKLWREADPERAKKSNNESARRRRPKINATTRLYRKNNPEKSKERDLKYRIIYKEKRKLTISAWRKKNHQKTKESQSKWKKANPHKVRDMKRKHIKNISPSYISVLLGIPVKDISPILIQSKRNQIKAIRALKQIKELTNEKNTNEKNTNN